jgi:hypothetical protein
MKKMYNEELKKKYIEMESFRNTNLTYFMTKNFERSAEYEEYLGKDICCFTVKEILEYYKRLYSSSIETLLITNSQFGLYTRFARKQGAVADGQNHFDEIDNELLATCVDKTLFEKRVYTREQLADITKVMINPCEVFIVYALFEGITGKMLTDTANVTKDSFVGNVVHLSKGRELTVSDELLKAMEESAEEKVYYSICSGKEIKLKEGDDKIVKEMNNTVTKNELMDYRRVQNRLLMASKGYGLPQLSARMLTASGEIDMIRKFMKQDSCDADTAIRSHRKEIEYRYGRISSIPRFILKYKEFLGE